MYETPSRASSRTGYRSNPPGVSSPLAVPAMPAPSPSMRPTSGPFPPGASPLSPSTPTLPPPSGHRPNLRKPASMQSLSSVRSANGRSSISTPRGSQNEVYRGRIHVGVRAKPAPASTSIVLDREAGTIDHENAGLFRFDKVYTGSDTNKDVFGESVEPLIQQVCQGFNATVFAYGTTGSGKTYTMQGTDSDPGVITRSVTELFDQLPRNAQVTLSYFEIYNERVYDLLSFDTQQPIEVHLRDTSSGETQVVGQREVEANSASELLNFVALGDQLRRTSSTQYNEHSSRSHAVVRIQIINNNNLSVLYLCDLAGSEKATVHSERRKEGSYINKSLLTLSSVISLLSKGGGQHVPYRDSKLTRLLQPSLSGSALVSMICTIHTSQGNTETVNSLRFAAKAKDIVVTARKASVFDDISGNTAPSAALMKLVEQLQTENLSLRKHLEKTRIERDDLRDRLDVYETAENSNADASIEAMIGISGGGDFTLDGNTTSHHAGRNRGNSGSSSISSLSGSDFNSNIGQGAGASGNASQEVKKLRRELEWYKSENGQLNERVSHLVAELASIDANIANLSSAPISPSSSTAGSAARRSASPSPSTPESRDSAKISNFGGKHSRDDEIAELREQLRDKELVISCMSSITEAQRRARSWKTDVTTPDTSIDDLQVENLHI